MALLIRSGTKMQTNNLSIDEKQIEKVRHFSCLGTCKTENDDEMNEIQRRINLANKAYFGLTNVIKSKVTKISLYKAMVQPTLLYRSETYNL